MAIMHKVIEARPGEGYRLWVRFEDGVEGWVDLSGRLFGPVFEPLRDKAAFARVQVDEFGAIVWPNGADLAPDAIHDDLKKSITA